MTFVKSLRDAAMQCSDVDYRSLIRGQADSIEVATKLFAFEPTERNLRHLNGTWALGARLLKNIPPEAPPAPLSGSTEPARLAA